MSSAPKKSVTRIQLLGLILWRGGILLVTGTAFYEGIQGVLRIWRVPPDLLTGVSLIVTGVVLVLISMIIEAVHDSRMEKRAEREPW